MLRTITTIIVALLIASSAGVVTAQSSPLEFECSGSPIDDWPDQLSVFDQRVLCHAVSVDIQIEVIGTNRILPTRSGDVSRHMYRFRQLQDSAEVQPILIEFLEYNATVVEMVMRDGNGERIARMGRPLIWTREFRPTLESIQYRTSDTTIVLGGSQAISCAAEIAGDAVGEFTGCLANRTVLVCDRAHVRPSGVRFVQYPVLTVRSHGTEAAAIMVNEFEVVAQELERMQLEILEFTCGSR